MLRPQPWAGETQLLQSCRCLCKPLPEPSPRGGSSTSSPIPTLLKPLPGLPNAPPRPSPRGGSSFLLCFRRFDGAPSLWGGLGRGLSALATPTELLLFVGFPLSTRSLSTYRVACFARNPGLGKRNSYRVAAACGDLSPNPHQERKNYNKPHPNHLHQKEGVFSNCLKYSKKKLLPLGEGRDGAFV